MAADSKHNSITYEPNWLTGDLGKYPNVDTDLESVGGAQLPKVTGLIQQSDLLKPLLMDIAKKGLAHAYNKCARVVGSVDGSLDDAIKQTNNPKHVIIVGAGMAGLVAAHELVRVGHKVTIVETQDRVGGRVKTISHDGGETKTPKQGGNFAKGLYVDAGAMRLPCSPDTKVGCMTHFLSDYYGELFQLTRLPFVNSDENAFLKFYNTENIKIAEWKATPESREYYTSKFWPGWDDKIKSTGAKDKFSIKDIDDYYMHTTEVIIDQLRFRLAGVIPDRSKQAAIWDSWIATWSQFSLCSFLTSTLDDVVARIPQDSNSPQLDKLGYLLPWPQAAITAYTQFTFTEHLDITLDELLRVQMGEWWSPHMHYFEGGMSRLPLAFEEANRCKDKHHRWEIVKNCTVNKIAYDSSAGNMPRAVTVSGYKHESGDYSKPKSHSDISLTGAAVIITTPMRILRQMEFEPVNDSLPLPHEFYSAISDIEYMYCTKIMLQCKTRFWEEEKYNIRGGSSRATSIGLLCYPSNPKELDPPAIPADIRGGILLVYTWGSKALKFGSLDPEQAVKELVHLITEIHPEMEKEYDDVWAIEAWHNNPSAQGAFCDLKPSQFRSVSWLMYPWENLYFAGETISFTLRWIQGALESGLRAAYQFYARNESEASNCIT